MKAFIFEGFTQSKIYGSTQAPVEMIVVKNAADKAAARVLAEKVMTKGLRMVGAGQTYKDERTAVEVACTWATKYSNGGPKCVWFAVDAKPSENNIRLQSELAVLVGMRAA